jgi:hypothetical protein
VLVSPLAFAAVTFDERLCVNAMFVEPALPHARATIIVERALTNLRRML